MKSMDIFDTIIGRWYYTPDSIFDSVESKVSDLVVSFKYYRKTAESVTSDKTFDGIYKKFSELTGVSESVAEVIKIAEFDEERLMTFPIMENVRKLDNDTVLISDTYFNKEQLIELLKSNGIVVYKDIICSYDGKSSGNVWNSVKPYRHIGDNKHSDVDKAREAGINAELFNSGLTPNESWTLNKGFPKLAYLMRAVRLSNPYSDAVKSDLWYEQTQSNIPLLVLISNYLESISNDYSKYLFTQRDCCNLYEVFSHLYNNIPSYKFYSNRKLYSNPTKSFMKYTEELVDSEALIIDLQGTGDTCFSYFKDPNFFTAVYSDLDNKHQVISLVHRKEGFSDKIERVNYYEYPSYSDVIKVDGEWSGVSNSKSQYFSYIIAQRLSIKKCIDFIDKGLSVEKKYDMSLFRDFLKYLENNCVVCKYIDHEVM